MADQNGDNEGVIVIPNEQNDLWTGKTHNETLSIGIEYAKNWNLIDAFRELLLNWMFGTLQLSEPTISESSKNGLDRQRLERKSFRKLSNKNTASGYYWRLKWKTNDKTVVDCGISKVDAKDGDKDLPQNPDETQFRLPNPSQDVSVKIGTVYGTSGSPLTEIHTKQWLETYLYFNCSGPKEIIQTKYGAVILRQT
ncbi:uncharacterized protein EAF02_009121 [Botrytis sinoallii]|uniref:uncharacterized protein n=1 Tax=Botrytis sinoallii TaxID=1463999 RepID=UPI0018FFF3E3|nr:uncharacterized protein EAF02_009121 [Botrytis sinoallii]KAF7872016.1 hypothetical protein EAF02_009121 [Botrytis sinoallii]